LWSKCNMSSNSLCR